MKYIKTYENNIKKYFYYIPSEYIKDYFEICINKLDTTEKIKKEILEHIYYSMDYSYGLYIAIYNLLIDDSDDRDWSYYNCESNKEIRDGKNKYIEDGLIFKGEIIPEPWEISANKYNL